jgi:hypothetical protein
MHMLSHHNRSEFLACPQLIRFEFAKGYDDFEPTFLIKGSTLLLKYIVLGAPMRLAIALVGDRLLSALKVFDDGNDGGILWSIVEREEELKGLRALAQGKPLQIFLFNEIAVNVAWNEFAIGTQFPKLTAWVDGAKLGRVDHAQMRDTVDAVLNRLHASDQAGDDLIVLELDGTSDWKPVRSTFITSHASASLIDIFDNDEGGQQEQIGIWLTDNLHPLGVHHSPQVPKGAGTRELTDILLSHQFGATFIESKVLSVLTRDRLPDRAKLKHDVKGHITKAFSQLRGGIRKVRSGVDVTTKDGAMIEVDREHPAHAIVLVPDLDLIDDPETYGMDFIRDFMKASGGFPHLLDISELLRVVQAAEIIAKRGKETTPMQAFDYYLVERMEKAVDAGTLCIEVLLRFEGE